MSLCDSCLYLKRTVIANNVCEDCEEQYCDQCKLDHTKFRAFRSHNIIELEVDDITTISSDDYASHDQTIKESVNISSEKYASHDKTRQDSVNISSEEYASHDQTRHESVNISSEEYASHDQTRHESVNISSEEYASHDQTRHESVNASSEDYASYGQTRQESVNINSDVNRHKTKDEHEYDYPSFDLLTGKHVYDYNIVDTEKGQSTSDGYITTAIGAGTKDAACSIYVDIEDTDLARKIGIAGMKCLLEVHPLGVTIYQKSPKPIVFTCEFRSIRKYKATVTRFSIEIGRRCEFGEGKLYIKSSQSLEIKKAFEFIVLQKKNDKSK